MSVLTIEKVSNEGAEIYCERRGNGPSLLLIHGAMKDAGFYSSIAEILADKFKVMTVLNQTVYRAFKLFGRSKGNVKTKPDYINVLRFQEFYNWSTFSKPKCYKEIPFINRCFSGIKQF